MESTNPLPNVSAEEQTPMKKETTSVAQDNNSQGEIAEVPIVSPPKPLTMEDVGGVEELYKAHRQNKSVIWPGWIEETERRIRHCSSTIISTHYRNRNNTLSKARKFKRSFPI